MDLKDLEKGKIYLNNDLVEIFKCSPQGGMRRSLKTNTLVLVSDQRGKNPYRDIWEKGVLHYTGMGLNGDQSLERAQNKTLKNSNNTDIKIHLFEKYKEKEYIYKGQVRLTESPYAKLEKDSNGQIRTVYKFPLKIIE